MTWPKFWFNPIKASLPQTNVGWLYYELGVLLIGFRNKEGGLGILRLGNVAINIF